MNKAPENICLMPREEACVRAREIGRRFFVDRAAIRAAWPELAGYFGTTHAPWAADDVSDDEFDALQRDLLREYRAGIEEAISKLEAMEANHVDA